MPSQEIPSDYKDRQVWKTGERRPGEQQGHGLAHVNLNEGGREEIREQRKRVLGRQMEMGPEGGQAPWHGKWRGHARTCRGSGMPGAGILGPVGALVTWKDPAKLEGLSS